MSKLGDIFKDGRVVGAVVAVGLTAVIGVGVANVAGAAAGGPEPAAVQTVESIDFGSIPYTNGLADEQQAEAAAAEQARIAAEAEAARVAAEAEAARIAAEQAAAAAEAERVAAEQQQAEQEAPASDEGGEEPSSGGIPATWVDLGNGTGMWDFSNCPTQSGSTGADGNVYCN